MPTWIEEHQSKEFVMALRILREGRAPLLILHGLCVCMSECEDLVLEAVKESRQEGRSWVEIGESMGISRQAARRRFMHLDSGD